MVNQFFFIDLVEETIVIALRLMATGVPEMH